jgi:hypothetical protein
MWSVVTDAAPPPQGHNRHQNVWSGAAGAFAGEHENDEGGVPRGSWCRESNEFPMPFKRDLTALETANFAFKSVCNIARFRKVAFDRLLHLY